MKFNGWVLWRENVELIPELLKSNNTEELFKILKPQAELAVGLLIRKPIDRRKWASEIYDKLQ